MSNFYSSMWFMFLCLTVFLVSELQQQGVCFGFVKYDVESAVQKAMEVK